MVNRKFNGVDIGDSAVEFFEKLAILESGGKYNLADQSSYIGKYQIGTDVLMDMGWLPKGSTWANARFIGEGATKWKLRGKRRKNLPQGRKRQIFCIRLKMVY